MKTYPITLILLVSSAFSLANEEGFNRYQPILDKKIFGQEPPEADMLQVTASESFARSLRLSMLFEGTDGTVRAGIVDTSDSSKEKNYILRLGELQEGFEMIEADVKTSEAMIRKGQEVALFKLESAIGETVAQREPAQPSPSSYSERRRAQMRRLEERAQAQSVAPPPESRLTGEALKQHLEQVQMDAIRNGLPPLPMQLTPEMDAQLVSEGVLPPQ